MAKENLIEDVLTLSDNLFRKLLPAFPEELLKLDLTMAQLKIMLLLFFQGQLRMSQLASELDVTLPSTTSLIDRLVEKGYVLRESLAEDRRVVLCQLSDSGHKTISGIWHTARGRTHQLLSTLDMGKLQMIREALATMMESAETDSERNIVGKS